MRRGPPSTGEPIDQGFGLLANQVGQRPEKDLSVTVVAWARPRTRASRVELAALMAAGRWKSSKIPARYTERQAADRGAVARYYQEGGG